MPETKASAFHHELAGGYRPSLAGCPRTNLILRSLARGVLMLCHVIHDHRAACDHY
jgi:hypothetical protein